ncbi:hypothetical protein NN4_12470 [Nocardia ninae NBRC 108245]|uniref:Uncharacterized protein n=1 Tax=Nocardia ninae NBRC 108245 TaxID=1210091 RepID=A0A511M9D8_9NOCA|nr:hypothetical protein NN4_12470 [Nocardia ninae NBRC 108245]
MQCGIGFPRRHFVPQLSQGFAVTLIVPQPLLQELLETSCGVHIIALYPGREIVCVAEPDQLVEQRIPAGPDARAAREQVVPQAP